MILPVDLSNVDKLDIDKLKNVPSGLSNLEKKVDKLDVDKLVPAPVDLSKLSDVVKNDVAKKDVYNAKIKKNNEDKIPSFTNFAAKASLKAKIIEFKVEIPSVSNLVKKQAGYNTKINEIEKKITDHNHVKNITTPELNKLTSENFAAILKQAHLVNKADFNGKLRNLNKRLL